MRLEEESGERRPPLSAARPPARPPALRRRVLSLLAPGAPAESPRPPVRSSSSSRSGLRPPRSSAASRTNASSRPPGSPRPGTAWPRARRPCRPANTASPARRRSPKSSPGWSAATSSSHTIVVPEGLTADETFELFWSRGISRQAAFQKAFTNPELIASVARGAPDLEGFLFPDTYVVTRSTLARQIVETMLANFRRHFTPEMRERAAAMDFSIRDAVTLASIVQKETLLAREAPVIAGVYWNRLEAKDAPPGGPDGRVRDEARREMDRNAVPLGLRLSVGLQHLPPRRAAAGPDLQPGGRRSEGRGHAREDASSSTSWPTARAATPSPRRSRSISTPSPPPAGGAIRRRHPSSSGRTSRSRPPSDARHVSPSLTDPAPRLTIHTNPRNADRQTASPVRKLPSDGGAGRGRPRAPVSGAPSGREPGLRAPAHPRRTRAFGRRAARRDRGERRGPRFPQEPRRRRGASTWTPPTASRTSPGASPTGGRSPTCTGSADRSRERFRSSMRF